MDGVVRGLVKVVGNMVETRFGKDVHWSSKVVRVVLEVLQGSINILPACQIVRKMDCVMTSWFRF